MAFVTLEDLAGQMEVIVFPNTLEKYGDFLKPELPLWVEGKVSVREDEAPKILVEMIKPLVKGDKMPAGKSGGETAGHGNGGREGKKSRQVKETGSVRYVTGNNAASSVNQVKEGFREGAFREPRRFGDDGLPESAQFREGTNDSFLSDHCPMHI